MILYNVTVAIDKKVENDWLIWMKNVHIPEVMETNQFETYKFFKVMNTDDPESSSYSVQYFFREFEEYSNVHGCICSRTSAKGFVKVSQSNGRI